MLGTGALAAADRFPSYLAAVSGFLPMTHAVSAIHVFARTGAVSSSAVFGELAVGLGFGLSGYGVLRLGLHRMRASGSWSFE